MTIEPAAVPFDIEVPVAVIGAGAAGLVAALARTRPAPRCWWSSATPCPAARPPSRPD